MANTAVMCSSTLKDGLVSTEGGDNTDSNPTARTAINGTLMSVVQFPAQDISGSESSLVNTTLNTAKKTSVSPLPAEKTATSCAASTLENRELVSKG